MPAVVRCHEGHEAVLTAALRAPSAHNAQAWRLVPVPDGESYEVHYDCLDYLPYDPDDRDACLGMGAFVETLVLAGDARGFEVHVDPVLEWRGSDLDVARVRLRRTERTEPADPLARAVGDRVTNRNPYEPTPLPDALLRDLAALGCRLMVPDEMADLVRKASILSWGDPRFVRDLKTWMNWDPAADVGMEPNALCLTPFERRALRFALWVGRLPRWASAMYVAHDVGLLRSAPAVAVLTAPDRRLPSLFEAGRRLLRAWVTICAHGASYHPISIAVDVRQTAADLDALLGETSVAMFRIGYGPPPPVRSNRRSLESVLRAPANQEVVS